MVVFLMPWSRQGKPQEFFDKFKAELKHTIWVLPLYPLPRIAAISNHCDFSCESYPHSQLTITDLEAILPAISLVPCDFKSRDFPCPSFPLFSLDFLVPSCFFLVRFPFFSRDLGGSAGIKNPCPFFLGGGFSLPCNKEPGKDRVIAILNP